LLNYWQATYLTKGTYRQYEKAEVPGDVFSIANRKCNASFILLLATGQGTITLSGKVTEARTGKPIPFVNIGIFEKNIP
jgi:hypothetical protein